LRQHAPKTQISPPSLRKYEVDPKRKLEHQLEDLQESIRNLKGTRVDYGAVLSQPSASKLSQEDSRVDKLWGKVVSLDKKVAELQSKLQTADEDAANLSAVTVPRTTYREPTFRPSSAGFDFSAAFEANIKDWQARVLTPALQSIKTEVVSSLNSSPEPPRVREMLRRLHHKQAERAAKLSQLNKKKEQRLHETSYLLDYDEPSR
jgi:DNA repair exonuclease SbcCD ATPase subunit